MTWDDTHSVLLPCAVLLVALLYSTVGHAGASGYLAAMALAGIAPGVMRPTALLLNCLVASLASCRFWRAGYFKWDLFWPLATASVPAAWLGGQLRLPTPWYRPILGGVLAWAAVSIWRGATARPTGPTRVMRMGWALGMGGVIGFTSGLIGVGGGIFLTPVLLLARWAEPKEAAAVSALFILVNSLAGLAGAWTEARVLPSAGFLWAACALAGGWIGAGLGSQQLKAIHLRRVLAAVMAFAAAKLVWL